MYLKMAYPRYNGIVHESVITWINILDTVRTIKQFRPLTISNIIGLRNSGLRFLQTMEMCRYRWATILDGQTRRRITLLKWQAIVYVNQIGEGLLYELTLMDKAVICDCIARINHLG